MTNLFAPFGFRNSRAVTGLGHTLNNYTIASGYAADIGFDDVVKSDGAGGIAKAGSGDAILGTFKGYGVDSTNLGSITNLIPFSRNWVSGTAVASTSRVIASVHDDPFETFEVQALGSITAASIGALVDLVDYPIESVFGRSRQMVSAPTTYYNITGWTISDGGADFVAATTKLYVNGIEWPATFTVDGSGTITAITASPAIKGLATNSATILITGAGSGHTITATYSAGQTASQFRVERILEKATRQTNAAGNDTTGYGLTEAGAYAIVEVKCMKHERGGAAMGVAV